MKKSHSVQIGCRKRYGFWNPKVGPHLIEIINVNKARYRLLLVGLLELVNALRVLNSDVEADG